ncbi:MAG: hypothetical protein QOI81_1605 [Actinomycetota bacterium]|nr:hypothetical protein [Actinomycetota bacterium]
MRTQKEHQDLGFGGQYEPVAPRVQADQNVGARRPDGVFSIKLWMIVVGVLVVGVGAFGFLKLLSSAGKQIASDNQDMLGQVDKAHDADAKTAAQTALIAAKTIFASDVSYKGVNPASMSQAQPGVRYTTGPSTSSTVVSVSSSATEVGIAVSAGKTCWYLLDSPDTGTTYGSGTGACTGSTAMRLATSPAW